MKKIKTQSGFSVLFASLIGSLVLSIGMAILSITLKQISLASSSRESQRAFYAADSGVEFALYLDRGAGLSDCPEGIFPIPGKSDEICKVAEEAIIYKGINPDGSDDSTLNDDGTGTLSETENIQIVDQGNDFYTTEVSVKRTNYLNNPICFDLLVTKTSSDGGLTVKTRIESRGYSTCNQSAANRFERAILTTY